MTSLCFVGKHVDFNRFKTHQLYVASAKLWAKSMLLAPQNKFSPAPVALSVPLECIRVPNPSVSANSMAHNSDFSASSLLYVIDGVFWCS